MAATDTPETFSQHTMTVDGHERSYYVRLPAGYDQNRAYPLTIMGPGCGGRGDQSIPIQDAAGPDAIVVGLNISAEVTGRDCFMTESAESPELPYFDAMWAEVSAGYCIDTKRVLYGGFSSGAWLANLYGCAKSNILRVQASVAGGPPPLPECPDPIAAIFIHDVGDNTNGLGGVQAARDRVLMKNGCTGTETMPWDPEYPDCEIYTGCPADYPVVWCEPDSGMGHNPLDAMSAPAFWKFFSALGPKP
jgi:poly(3-hydroxybutyrate) depolymerase